MDSSGMNDRPQLGNLGVLPLEIRLMVYQAMFLDAFSTEQPIRNAIYPLLCTSSMVYEEVLFEYLKTFKFSIGLQPGDDTTLKWSLMGQQSPSMRDSNIFRDESSPETCLQFLRPLWPLTSTPLPS